MADEREFEGADALYENLARAEDAAEAIEHMAGFELPPDWRVRLEEDGTSLLLRADGDAWSIFAPAGADPDDAALLARKVHGKLAALADGWDLDR
jgi:uncharacterized heparinase superfamily protein